MYLRAIFATRFPVQGSDSTRGNSALPIRSGDVEQHRLHSRIARADIVDRIHVADIKAVGRISIHLAQSRRKDCRMRLLMANDSRVGDAGETIENAATAEYGINLAVGIGDHGNRVLLPNPIERVTRPRQDLVPIRRALCVLDECVAYAIVEGVQVLKQVGVKGPPEAVIDLAAHQALVEFLFGAALQRLPGFERRVTVPRPEAPACASDWEKQGVTHVEENETAFGHESILPNRRERARPLTIRLPVPCSTRETGPGKM